MAKFSIGLLFLVSLAACGGAPGLEPRSPGYDLDGDGSSGRGSFNASPSQSAPPTGTPSAVTLGCRARGFNFVCWYDGCYEQSSTPSSLTTIKSFTNWVEIVPTWYQADAHATSIGEDSQKSPKEADLRYVIALARRDGFRVALKPHIDLLDGGWRGNIDPQDLAAWQASYEEYILHFASLAQELGVEVLSVGAELKTRSGDLAFWRQLVPKIRRRYSGFLTYAANWDEYDQVNFWDLLDFVGIDFYFPLTQDPNAGQSAMEAGLEPIRARLASFSQRQNRPFLFTEIGYRSLDGMQLRPYDYQLSGTVDLQEQADAYAAVLTVFGDQESWLEGIFWWDMEPTLPGGRSDDGYSPFGKPAADVLQTFWGGDTCVES